MAENFVTVQTFGDSVEAELAKNLLTEEGIPAFLADDATAGWWGLSGAVSSIKLQVPEEHERRAAAILAAIERKKKPLDEEEPLPSAEGIQAGWTCPLCGAVVDPDLAVCPVCEQAADEEQERTAPSSTALTATPPVQHEEDEDLAEEEEEPFSSPGESLARRAWKAAFAGILFFPLTLYSIYLLFKLAAWPGELSQTGLRKAVGAVIVDLLVCLVWGMFVLIMH